MPTITHPFLVNEHYNLDTYTTRLRTLDAETFPPFLSSQLPISSSVDSALVYFSAPVVAPVLKSLEPAATLLQEPDLNDSRTILYIEKHDLNTIKFVLYPDDLQCLVRSSSTFKNISLTAAREWPTVDELAVTPLVPITYDTKIHSTKRAHTACSVSLNRSMQTRAQQARVREAARQDALGDFERAQEAERMRYLTRAERQRLHLHTVLNSGKPPLVLMNDLFPLPTQAQIKRFQFPLPPEHTPHRAAQVTAKVSKIVNVLHKDVCLTPTQPLGNVDPAQSGVLVPDRLVQTMALMPAGVLSIELDSQSPDCAADKTQVRPGDEADIDTMPVCWRVVLTFGKNIRYVLPVATTYLTPKPIVIPFSYKYSADLTSDGGGYDGLPVPASLSLGTARMKAQGVMHAEQLADALGQYPMRHFNRTAGPSPCGVRKAAGARAFAKAIRMVFNVRVNGLAKQLDDSNLETVVRAVATGPTAMQERGEISRAMYRVLMHYFSDNEDTHSRMLKRLPKAVAEAYVEFIRQPNHDLGVSGLGIAYDMFVVQLMRDENIRSMYLSTELRRTLDNPDMFRKANEAMNPGILFALEKTTGLLLPHAYDTDRYYEAPKLDGINPLGIPDNVHESKLDQHHRRVRKLIAAISGDGE